MGDPLTAGLGLLGGGLGAVAGGKPKESSSLSQVLMPGASDFEKDLGTNKINEATSLLDFLKNSGGGMADYGAGIEAQRDFGAALKAYADQGGVPGEQDFLNAKKFTDSTFLPQQMALRQEFQKSLQQANQQAALMGRSMNDPILANKLQQGRLQQSLALGAQQGAATAQYAQQLPQQRLNALQQRANVLGQLGQQALQRRLQGFNLMQGLEGGDFQRRFSLADKINFGSGGGGTSGAISGGFGGAKMGGYGGGPNLGYGGNYGINSNPFPYLNNPNMFA